MRLNHAVAFVRDVGVVPVHHAGAFWDVRFGKPGIRLSVDRHRHLTELFKQLIKSRPDGSDLQLEQLPPRQESALAILEDCEVA